MYQFLPKIIMEYDSIKVKVTAKGCESQNLLKFGKETGQVI